MTNPNKAELRRLAEAATPGQWVTDGEDIGIGGNVIGVYVAHEDGGRIGQVFANCLVPTDAKCRANAAFMAAANPAAVLSLLDELEAKDNTLLAITTRHFAESWSRRATDAKLDEYLSAGITQLEAERDAALAEREELRRLLECFVRGESDSDENQSERHMYVTEAQSLLAHMGGEIKAHTLVPDEVLRNQSAEIEAFRKDAERYRLICEKAIDVTFWAAGPAPIHGCVEIDPDQYPVDEFGSAKPELDALIDAEMSQEVGNV